MFGLVSYEGSSDEDGCDSTEEKPQTVPKQSTVDSHISDEEDDLSITSRCATFNHEINASKQLDDSILDNLDSIQVSNDNKVFSHLPAPASHSLNSLASVLSSGISKTKGQSSVKITIPSLDEFDDVDEDFNEPKKTKIKASLKGSGLFSILPKPRHEFLATQNVHSTSSAMSNIKCIPNTLVPRQIAKRKMKTSNKKSDVIDYDSNESDDETLPDDNFFTIPTAEEKQDNVPDKNIEEYMKPIVQEKPKKDIVSNGFQEQGPSAPPSEENYVSYPSVEPSSYDRSLDEPIELNDEVIRKLGGRKRKGEDFKLIEVDGSALRPEPGEWLTKQLSQETGYKPSCKKGTGPTSQQKRKHQITYLAFQAKANELDLKNQWANNRQSKRQTQSKYGF